MKIMYNISDIFALPTSDKEAVCITTNGQIKKDGTAVMGRGIAKEAKERFTGLARYLGMSISLFGNHSFNLGFCRDNHTWHRIQLYSIPTKHHWKDKSDLTLIRESLTELVAHCNFDGITTCYLPCPGCSNGGLDWETQVKPICEELLDDRFIIADRSLTQ